MVICQSSIRRFILLVTLLCAVLDLLPMSNILSPATVIELLGSVLASTKALQLLPCLMLSPGIEQSEVIQYLVYRRLG